MSFTNFSDREKKALMFYSIDSRYINDIFRNNQDKPLDELKKFVDKDIYEIIEILTGVMSCLKEETILYRGLERFSTDDFDIGTIFSNICGFQSTSFKKDIARKYAGENGIILIIKATVGTQGVFLGKYSTNPNDDEFLLDYRYDFMPYKIDYKKNEVHVILRLKEIYELRCNNG